MFGRRPLTGSWVIRLTDRMTERTIALLLQSLRGVSARPQQTWSQVVTVKRNDRVPTSSHIGRTASMPLLLQPGSSFWVNYGRCMTSNSANRWSIQTQLLLLICCSQFSFYTSVIASVSFNAAPPSYPLWHSIGSRQISWTGVTALIHNTSNCLCSSEYHFYHTTPAVHIARPMPLCGLCPSVCLSVTYV